MVPLVPRPPLGTKSVSRLLLLPSYPSPDNASIDINKLVGNNTRVQIPEVVVKWITYALVLHIVALVLAAISAVFGLLAHVREFSMSCFSTCISGLGATVALLAFIFDITFFFLAKSRINSVSGGSATMGNAIWLTLVAWILLFFSGCFYGLGRCCIRRRPRDMVPKDGGGWMPTQSTGPTYEEQMRLDAVKAEADRKARQKQGELGLPSFPEYDPTQPLTADAEHEPVSRVPYRDAQYAAAPVGSRAVDEYYAAGNNAYPPRRQPTTSSAYTQNTQRTGYSHSQQTSGYAPSTYGGAAAVSTGPPVSGGYLNLGNTGNQHEQYTSQASAGYVQDATNANYQRPSTNACKSPLACFSAGHDSHISHRQFPALTSWNGYGSLPAVCDTTSTAILRSKHLQCHRALLATTPTIFDTALRLCCGPYHIILYPTSPDTRAAVSISLILTGWWRVRRQFRACTARPSSQRQLGIPAVPR